MKRLPENIISVGVVDNKVRIFHGYATPMGTTYNAFLILDKEVTLIDFVKAPFADEFLQNITKALGNRTIDHIICNHVEPDHSGALPVVVAKYPHATVYGTASCEKELKAYYPEAKYPFKTVKMGDTLQTGSYTLQFFPMPMVHWPDSMGTYLVEEKILFSNDAFGQHAGTGELYADELSTEVLMEREADYYANIILPFGNAVKKLLEQLETVEIKMICPSHGVILPESFIPMIWKKYHQWSENYTNPNKVVIVYDTMWGTTKKMADALAVEWSAKGMEVELISLTEKHYSYAMGRILEAKYIFVGSPTLNSSMLPTVAAFLTYMKGLKPKGRIGLAFGSYGWSGESPKHINEVLESAGFETLEPQRVLWNM